MISVIVPVFNVEMYLHRCIESLLGQSYSEIEVILVDDGSTDKSGQICDQYEKIDTRVKVIHKQNGGVSEARNTALDLVSGDYVTFCDSDDYYDTEWLENLYTAMTTNIADVVVGQYRVVSKNGEPIKEKSDNNCIVELMTVDQKIDYLIQNVLIGNTGWEIWARLFRADIIRQNHIRFCETCGNFAEDMGFVLEYMLHCQKVVNISACGYNYFRRDESMMDSSSSKIKLDELNEVSFYFYSHFMKEITIKEQQNLFPVLHFFIMYDQYSKVINPVDYSRLSTALTTIRRKKWFSRQTRLICKNYRKLKLQFGKNDAARIVLFSQYCAYAYKFRTMYALLTLLYYKFIFRPE